MKIALSNLYLSTQAHRGLATARVQNTQVIVNSSEGNNTSGQVAGLSQIQQLTFFDSTTSHLESQVKDVNGKQTHYIQQQTLENIVNITMEQNSQIRALNQLSDNGEPITQIVINQVMNIESSNDLQFQSLGTVTTEDGREIEFLMELTIERRISGEQSSLFMGNRDLIDPLVINLNGQSAQLSDSHFEFDLNSDGTLETLHQTAQGTGFIAFDKNKNGIIDNGKELFGPTSNHGFDELAKFDDDNNGWIDENDEIFSQLSFMDFDEQGIQRIQSIQDVGIGALSLHAVATPHDLYNSQGQYQGMLANTGMALTDDGKPLYLQELLYADRWSVPQQINIGSIDIDGNNVFVENANVLTQFQISNPVIEERNADTLVSIERDAPLMTIITLARRGQSEFNYSDSNMHIFDPSAKDVSQDAMPEETSENKEDITFSKQAHFREIIKENNSVILDIRNTQSESNPQNYIEVEDLTQSIFWEYNGANITQQTSEDKKLAQLKQLIENLKTIREQQVKFQEKLGIYTYIDQG